MIQRFVDLYVCHSLCDRRLQIKRGENERSENALSLTVFVKPVIQSVQPAFMDSSSGDAALTEPYSLRLYGSNFAVMVDFAFNPDLTFCSMNTSNSSLSGAFSLLMLDSATLICAIYMDNLKSHQISNTESLSVHFCISGNTSLITSSFASFVVFQSEGAALTLDSVVVVENRINEITLMSALPFVL